MNKKYAAVIIAIIAVIFGGYYYLNKNRAVNGPVLKNDNMKTYSSMEYGITFKYPENYMYAEKDLGNAERRHHQIMLVEDTQENRDVFAGKSPGREGPVAITIDMYQNNLDKYSAEKWVRETSFSNFKQSDDNLIKTVLDEKEAVLYKWSGLYEADNMVVATGKFVYSIAVTYIAPEDRIRKDYLDVLGTIEIE